MKPGPAPVAPAPFAMAVISPMEEGIVTIESIIV